MTAPNVREAARRLTLADVCRMVGIKPRNRSLPCTVCNESRRGKGDARQPIGYNDVRNTWHCYRCDTGGDALDLLTWHRFGFIGNGASPDQQNTRRLMLRDAGLLAPEDRTRRNTERPRLHAVDPVPERPNYPPGEAVADIWRQCVPVTSDTEITRYLNLRMNHSAAAELFAGLDVCRALPCTASLPRWAARWERDENGNPTRPIPWTTTGHRLLFLARDHTGAPVTLTARRTIDGDTPKSLPPTGFSRRGSVLMCDRMAALMSHPRSVKPALGYDLRVWLVEGEMDALAAILHRAKNQTSTSARRQGIGQSTVIAGLQPGGWTRQHTDRLPPGCLAVIHPDNDPGGEKIGRSVWQAMVHRSDMSTVWGGVR